MVALPFRFAAVSWAADSGAAWAADARRIEDLGFSTLLVADHLSGPLGALPACMAAAQATSTLRLGTLVLANDLRHPALLAKDAATIDFLSDGRFELGIGAGWHLPDYSTTGIPFDRPGVRVARLRESIEIMKALFAGDAVTYAGEHYRITDLTNLPKPVQPGGPPIMVAGSRPKMLRLAADLADTVGITINTADDGSGPIRNDLTAEAYDEKCAALDAAVAAAGRTTPLERNVFVQGVFLTDDPIAKAEEVAATRPGPRLTAQQLLDHPHTLIGTEAGIVEKLLAMRERWELSYVAVHGAHAEALAPVVAKLAGS